ncbi:hypothetical protein PENSPDRAFT_689675 [Peniophora sp. CONT]|nr:hypothetical protein PENSPDRAFT_689675 [Peniophora sp. CONT]
MASKLGKPDITHLPAETLILIFSRLDYRGMIALRKCCRTFQHAIRDSAELRYIIALAAAGLCEDGSASGDLTSAELLDKLGRYEKAWKSMHWTEHIVLRSKPGERISAPSNPLIWQSRPEGRPQLRLFYAPSHLRDAVQHEWEIPMNGYPVFSYLFHMTHDLVVVQTADVPRPRFYFLMLSSGDPHPDAHLHTLLESDQVMFGLLLTRQYLIIPSDTGKQTVINWRTGRHVTHVMCNYYSVGFLDDDHLLVLPPPEQESGPCMLVYRLQPEPVKVIMAFGLPSFTAGHSMQDCTIKCAPCGSYHLPHLPHADRFVADPIDQLLTVGISEHNTAASYELVVHARALLAYLPVVSVSQTPVFIPWDHWGVTRSHIYIAIPPPRVGWLSNCIFGSRRITIRPRRRAVDDLLVADVWDYNARRIGCTRLLQDTIDASSRPWAVHDSDTVNNIWLTEGGPLVTRLPHIKVEMPLPEELQHRRPEEISLYINDNGVIACTDRVDGTPSVAHVLVF